MYRVALIGVVLLLAAPAMTTAQEKEKDKPAADKGKDVPISHSGTQPVSVVDPVVVAGGSIVMFIAIALLALVVYQLIMLRSDLERLIKAGGPSAAGS